MLHQREEAVVALNPLGDLSHQVLVQSLPQAQSLPLEALSLEAIVLQNLCQEALVLVPVPLEVVPLQNPLPGVLSQEYLVHLRVPLVQVHKVLLHRPAVTTVERKTAMFLYQSLFLGDHELTAAGMVQQLMVLQAS